MKIKTALLAAAALTVLVSCSNDSVLIESNCIKSGLQGAVCFGTANLDCSTRASKVAGNSFVSGNVIAVYGFQDSTLLFNDQQVTCNGGDDWSYSPLKYWEKGSEYMFYAMYPYSQSHSFNTASQSEPYFTITSFTVSSDTAQQVDVMIAKQNSTDPFNTVDFVFNHLLSNVNFMFRASSDFDFTGIDSICVLSFDITGLSSTADYTQTAWDAGTRQAVGSWGNHSGIYDFPVVTEGTVTDNTSGTSTLAADLLLMPQTIADSARLQLTYRIHYSDGSIATYSKGVRLAAIRGTLRSTGAQSAIESWQPDFIYSYTLAVNPAKSNVVYGSADIDGTIGADQVLNASVVIDENGNYWIDSDDDGAGDFPIVWEDIDGDGCLEGGIDMDGDGHIDNIDGDTVITPGTESTDPHLGPTDTRNTAENEGKDAILVYTGNEATGDTDPAHPRTQLEYQALPVSPRSNVIEFSATVQDWS